MLHKNRMVIKCLALTLGSIIVAGLEASPVTDPFMHNSSGLTSMLRTQAGKDLVKSEYFPSPVEISAGGGCLGGRIYFGGNGSHLCSWQMP